MNVIKGAVLRHNYMKLTENELIGKLRELRQIKPRNSWVSLTKTQILGEEPKFTFFPYLKPAFAGFIAIFVFIGIFSYDLVRNSLPGDLLYSIRKVAHEGQAVFISDEGKPAFQLKLANDRLEDLTKAPVKNLAPTINEFQANISEAAKNLAKSDAATSSPGVIKQIVEQTQKLKENMKIAASLGFTTGDIEATGELDKATAEYLIKYLDTLTLSEAQENILVEMQKLFGEKKYSEALELYLINQ